MITVSRQANISIQTNGIVFRGNTVVYKSSEFVELIGGFEVLKPTNNYKGFLDYVVL